ncbi:uroporphyrinogen decarboxylase family protein [Bacillus sp. 03113]|uniref:uroporphyrinogen decarboxylase family protein n=1 Tax=Bacillus sp. 03113 TaxID=2578211 RepID=UPI0015E8D2C1|nr:uroporphyrinogen decarboxylase family protein [Bacillus sp. 03113]
MNSNWKINKAATHVSQSKDGKTSGIVQLTPSIQTDSFKMHSEKIQKIYTFTKRNQTKGNIEKILEGEKTDFPSISLHKHFPLVDRNPSKFVDATLNFQKKFKSDYVKISYNGLYSIEDWGSQIIWPSDDFQVGKVVNYAINKKSDLKNIKKLSVLEGALAREVTVTKEIVRKINGEVPVIGTVFSPLTTLYKMSGNRLFEFIQVYPEALHHALEVITETTRDFVNALVESGIDGIYFATQLATTNILSVIDYNVFGRFYDLQVLDTVQNRTWFNILHIHGGEPMFKELLNYTVEAINWHDRKVPLSLKDARKLTDKILVGGIDQQEVLENGSDNGVEIHLKEAVSQLNDNKFVLAPGCVIPLTVPDNRLSLVRDIVNNIKN